ncbi:pheromone processing endoprotease, partial [Quaeritorhiza haematococci]
MKTASLLLLLLGLGGSNAKWIPSYTSLTDPSAAARLGKRSYSLVPPNDHANYHYFAIQLDTSSAFHPGKSLTTDELDDQAEGLAGSLGYDLLGRVGELDNFYLFAKRKVLNKRSENGVVYDEEHHRTRHVKRLLDSSSVVVDVIPQTPSRRLVKRVPLPEVEGLTQPPEQRAPSPGAPSRLADLLEHLGIIDPGFNKQWHLHNPEQVGNDLNITEVWHQGITGKNVTICFIDDGLDYSHPDLKAAFYEEGSYDFNDHVKLPTPRLSDDRHGTRCAGEVAAARNNYCGVGIAWDSRVSGIRILSGDLTEVDEAAAINYDYQHNHIYSCSWGPSDNGQAMDAPPKIVAEAFKNGIIKGRGGLGSLFVFATGNGGYSFDNCNFDGYTNSIYTITVGAIDKTNSHPGYSEACSAQMVVTYSSGIGGGIYTSDWALGDHGPLCTDGHRGTSAAAPLASGIYALVMSIRPEFTWRDFQHVSVKAALPITLDDPDWKEVAKGRLYNHKFGFGKLDAYRIIEASKSHKLVRTQTKVVSPDVIVEKEIPHGPEGITSIVTVEDEDLRKANMSRLEHITVTITIDHDRRGDVEVQIVSPHGYVSKLGTRRDYDTAKSGYRNWTFMSVKHWDEDPRGNWTLTVRDNANPNAKGTLNYWFLTLWGESGFGLNSTDEVPSSSSNSTEGPQASASVTTTVSTTEAAKTTEAATTVPSTELSPTPTSTTTSEPSSTPTSSKDIVHHTVMTH